MGFLKDVFNNFFGFIFGLLGIFGIIIAIVYWLSGNLLPWGIVYFVIGLILLAIARAFAKRG